MLYRALAVFLTLTFTFMTATFAAAQQPLPQKGNFPQGDLGWCTDVDPDSIYAGDGCGFRSAEDACQAQISTNYDLGRFEYRGTEYSSSGNSASCLSEEVDRSTGELFIGIVGARRQCAGGYTLSGLQCRIVNFCSTCNGPETTAVQSVGNPINVVTGEKKQTVTDYASADGRFVVKRHYNSAPFGEFGSAAGMYHYFGANWFLSNVPILLPHGRYPEIHDVFFSHPRGFGLTMMGSSLSEVYAVAGRRAIPYRAEYVDGLSSPPIGTPRSIEVTEIGTGTIFRYEIPAYARRTAGVPRGPVYADFGEGYRHNYTYNDNGLLTSLSDTYGRTMTIEYDTVEWVMFDALGNITEEILIGRDFDPPQRRQPTHNKISKITFPDGTYTEYDYDSPDAFNTFWGVRERLIGYRRYAPNGSLIKQEHYHYEDDRIPFALTGITDDADIRFATYGYDERGRGSLSEHAGGVNRTEIAYSNRGDQWDRGTSTVTNALGLTRTYDIHSRSGAFQVDRIDTTATSDVAAESDTFAYNNNGTTRERDGEGKLATFVRDFRGLPTAKTYGAESAEATTMTASYLPRFPRPTQTAEPGLTTDYTYDGEGRLLTMTQTDTSPTAEPQRVWTYTWAGSNISSVDGPLPGNTDTVSFSYINEKLLEVRNELGHITQITGHNAIGAPSRIVDPNGVETILNYDDRHRLRTITRDGQAVTQITYSATDLITSVTPPNGASLTFIYDDARRLMEIRNAVDDRIVYTRNLAGGITATRIQNGTGTFEFSVEEVRDELNRVTKAIGAGATGGPAAETLYSYDRNDNLTNITDPRSESWQQQFDGLDRLVKEIDPLGGETDYALANQMDSRNPLTGVTDARDVTTNYVRNGFGEVIREVSLEAGTTDYVRDTRGLITQMTDGRGVVSNYTYDDAGRLLTVAYPDSPGDDISYTYDEGPFGIGELTTVTENFGVTTYAYDSLGHMTAMTRTILGQSYTCLYEYDLAGEVIAMTYPSGRRVTFERDAAARIVAVRTTDPDTGIETTIAGGITYAPFGPLTGLAMGDGHNLSINYDTAYRAVTLRRTGAGGSLMDLFFEYDAAGDILAINDNVRADRTQSFAYDPVSRLTSATGGYGTIDYAYNLGGDRTARSWTTASGTDSENYVYDAAARLSRIDFTDAAANQSIKRQFGYNGAGQMISDTRTLDGTGFLYNYGINARGRLSSVAVGGTNIANYTYDESEQRIVKATGSDLIHYHYDHEGRLIAETDGHTGATLRDYVWLGLTPLAVIVTEEVTNPSGPCDEDLIAALTAELSAANSAADVIEAQISEHEATIAFREQKIADMYAQLDNLSGQRRTALEAKIVNWEGKIETLNDKIEDLTLELATIYNEIGQIEIALSEANANCEGGGTEIGTGTYYLHADHLGKPQFATDSTGAIVWDGGIATPFGEGVALAGAFAQNLMFPGQYADIETAANDNTPLFHNWHRTYDPTLGRYLQSDPIGLAGGINRYAYVGGNPLSNFDSMGLATASDVWGYSLSTLGKRLLKPKHPLAKLGDLGYAIGGLARTAIFVANMEDAPPEDCTEEKVEVAADDNNGNRGCKKANKHHLKKAGIRDPHRFKTEYGYIPNSRFDICACPDGRIIIAPQGQCGRIDENIDIEDTGIKWK